MIYEYKKYLPWVISGVSVLLALLHLLKPALGIDYIFLSFVLLALLPWALPLIKSFELPGGVKVEFKETKAATDKISTTLQVDDIYHRQKVSSPEIQEEKKQNFELLRTIAESDPNLAFVGFRIEVEKRIRKLGQINNIEIERVSLAKLVNELRFKEILSPNIVSGLMDLIGLGNKAAHGADVEPSAANWLLDIGPNIIAKLDETIENSKEKICT